MVDKHLREELLQSNVVYKGGFLEVRRDTVSMPGGGETTREYIVHSGAVAVVPMLDDGRLVMERQYRYPLGQVLLEFPAGKIDAGEDTFNAIVRELAEETGYRAREWARACVLHNAAAYSSEFIEIWFARGLSLGERDLDEHELIDICLLDEAELDALAARGELTDAKSLICLLWLQKWRNGLWPLQWRPAPA
jgi:ADP-ribose pyrophosphatase